MRSFWKFVKFVIDSNHRNYSYSLLNTMLQGNNVILNVHHAISLFLPIITMEYILIDKAIYIKMNSSYFNEYLKDSPISNYLKNDIEQIILISNNSPNEADKAIELTPMTTVLKHFKGLKMVCKKHVFGNPVVNESEEENEDIDKSDDESEEEEINEIEDELLEALKVCPWVEMIHLPYSTNQFIKYFLGLDTDSVKDAKSDLNKLLPLIEKAKPSWPNYMFLDLGYDSVTRGPICLYESNLWFLVYGTLKKAVLTDVNPSMIVDHSNLKKLNAYQLYFKDQISSFPISLAKIVFEERLLISKGPISINFEAFALGFEFPDYDQFFQESKTDIQKLAEDPNYEVSFNFNCLSYRRRKLVPLTEKWDWFKNIKVNIRFDDMEKDL